MHQFLLFCGCIVCGIIIAILYFAYNLLLKKSNLIVIQVIFDTLLGITAIFLIAVVSTYNDGIIRPYFFVGEIFGIFLLKEIKKIVLILLKKIKNLGNKKAKCKKNNIMISEFIKNICIL